MTTPNKTIILALPYLYGLDKCIEKNLRFHGYNVINLCYDDRDYRHPNLSSRIIALYHKHITHNSDYKKKLRFLPYYQDIQKKLSNLKKLPADYAICIRANIYPKEIIQEIRSHSHICVNYQWDGIDRFPDIFDYLTYFDRFFVFDPQDALKYPQYNFHTASNFYFDFPIQEAKEQSNTLYFLGGYDAKREQETKAFIACARKLQLPLDFYIYCKNNQAQHAFGNEGICYLNRDTVLTFEENLQKVASCGVVVDFVSPDHNGCSFRIFDALQYSKKLITNNATVKQYDFYHPNNIFIWNEQNSNDLENFLQLPYKDISNNIKKKYGFKNWLNYLLDIKPYSVPFLGK